MWHDADGTFRSVCVNSREAARGLSYFAMSGDSRLPQLHENLSGVPCVPAYGHQSDVCSGKSRQNWRGKIVGNAHQSSWKRAPTTLHRVSSNSKERSPIRMSLENCATGRSANGLNPFKNKSAKQFGLRLTRAA